MLNNLFYFIKIGKPDDNWSYLRSLQDELEGIHFQYISLHDRISTVAGINSGIPHLFELSSIVVIFDKILQPRASGERNLGKGKLY